MKIRAGAGGRFNSPRSSRYKGYSRALSTWSSGRVELECLEDRPTREITRPPLMRSSMQLRLHPLPLAGAEVSVHTAREVNVN